MSDVMTIPTVGYKESHFAVFPPALILKPILAGCPAKVCGECGAPWVRVVERKTENQRGPGNGNRQPEGHSNDRVARGELTRAGDSTIKTLHFTPTCSHDVPTKPGTVLDPFFGTGTTAVVAIENGRDWLGIELNPEYIPMAERRIAKARRPLPGMLSDVDEVGPVVEQGELFAGK